ncbi:unnamed protein product [Camellia sinensis]
MEDFVSEILYVEQEDKPVVRNLQHICVLQEAKQSRKSPLHLVIASSLHFKLGQTSDRDDNSGLSIRDSMEK